jgi:hypothetical protein
VAKVRSKCKVIPIAEFKQPRTDGRLVSSCFVRKHNLASKGNRDTYYQTDVSPPYFRYRVNLVRSCSEPKVEILKYCVARSVLPLEGLTKSDLMLIARVRRACLIILLQSSSTRKEISYCKSCEASFR